jgi:ERCC4-related helicase
VATSAAEEGIDVQACELVVRYSPSASGIQLMQSRGRGRKPGSKFLTILIADEYTQDKQLHAKSHKEQSNMWAYTALRRLFGT